MLSKLLFAGLVGALSMPVVSSAALMSFTDRPTWAAEAGPVTASEDFSSFAVDTSFDGSSAALAAGMSIGSINADGRGQYNLVDVVPLQLSETNVNGTAHALVLGGPFGQAGSVTPFISFGAPVRAFGADFRNLNDDLLRTSIDIYGGTTLLASFSPSVGAFGNLRFFGFVADAGETVTEIRFRWSAADAYGIDNIQIAAIPEPGTLALLGLGLAGLAATRRRKQ